MPTKIEWTDETWNPVVGCSKCSPGCLNCYAERMAWRLANMEICGYKKVASDIGWRGNIECLPHQLDKPLHWKKPRRIFVESMGDLFHEKVPNKFIEDVFWTMLKAKQHTFQVLTKRIDRALEFSRSGARVQFMYSDKPLSNVHLGVSISNQAEADEKIPILLQIPAAVRFVSLEPLLGEIDLTDIHEKLGLSTDVITDQKEDVAHFNKVYMRHIKSPLEPEPVLDWVIIGCESINGRAGRFRLKGQEGFFKLKHKVFERAFYQATNLIIRQCKDAGVPVFVKQIPLNGKVRKWIPNFFSESEWPEELRVQEKPE